MVEMKYGIREEAELLKGLLATIKGHFEPSMALKSPVHTYDMIRECLDICWNICEYLSETLTDRESQVVQLVVQGLSNGEIAEKLFIEEKTVKFHLSSIYKKLGAKNRAALIVEYYKNELIKARRDSVVLQNQVKELTDGADRRRGELPNGTVS